MDKFAEVYVGPWGGESGGSWNYILNGDITRIDLTYDDSAIKSIQFTTQDGDGAIHVSDVFGGSGSKTAEVIMNPAEEKLMIIWGKTVKIGSVIAVKSIVFLTTKNRPIAVNYDVDQNFDFHYAQFSPPYVYSFPQPFKGFFGRSSTLLNAIGVIQVYKTDNARPASGGTGGATWNYTPSGAIYQIKVTYDDMIRSIAFTNRGASGGLPETMKVGGADGSQTYTITIDPLKERFIGVQVSYRQEGSATVLSSVSFLTNLPRTFGSLGVKTDYTFKDVAGEGESLTGFHGHHGALVDGIGIYVKSTSVADSSTLVGPYGGTGKNKKEFHIVGLLSRISLTYGDLINSIIFQSTDESGNVYTSDTYGQEDGSKKFDVLLNIADGEKLVGMSGTVDGDRVTSLTFTTNNKIHYGPYGEVRGKAFSYPLRNGIISGFFVSYESELFYIGCFTKPDV